MPLVPVESPDEASGRASRRTRMISTESPAENSKQRKTADRGTADKKRKLEASNEIPSKKKKSTTKEKAASKSKEKSNTKKDTKKKTSNKKKNNAKEEVNEEVEEIATEEMTVKETVKTLPPTKTVKRRPLLPHLLIKVEELDLDRSYVVDVDEETTEEVGPRNPRWKHNGSSPLTDWKKLPADWSSLEPDLKDDDIDSHIDRCLERIADNIMPGLFEERMHELESKRKIARAGESPLLSWDVIQRVNQLKELRDWIWESDVNNQLANIYAVLVEYRAGRLQCGGTSKGLVTYWSHGVKLCEPRPFNWHEYNAFSKKYLGPHGFWVEGYDQVAGLSRV
ncbi:hypothetical protein N7466_003103 [Penicillium verhagenii]|uniref:uncharacterized protein n=1 Tax=Penicillium verhagenii TaxID=1562060 RepID=UPI002545B7F8|nr:uncharacterized protein N7466_003103 [Penicillium verhagenii]KAJ5936653.1 hypothetical protein N7466_003103 [Penicillium verhagenii]